MELQVKPEERLGSLLWNAFNDVIDLQEKKLAAVGQLQIRHQWILTELYYQPCTQTQLSEICRLHINVVARLLHYLLRRRLITKHKVQREQRISITPAGRRTMERLHLVCTAANDEICARLSAEQRAQLTGILMLIDKRNGS